MKPTLRRMGVDPSVADIGICKSCLPFAAAQGIYKGGTLAAGSTLDWGETLALYPEYPSSFQPEPWYKQYYAW